MTTQDRLKWIMQERGLRQKDIFDLAQPYCQMYGERLGLADISAYVNGKYAPAQKKLTLLSLALGVSEGWLMGLDVPMERATNVKQMATKESLTDTERQLLAAFRALNAQGQAMALATVEAYTHTDSLKQDTAPKVG